MKGVFFLIEEDQSRRRREFFWIVALAFLFLILTWIEIRLFSFSQTLPFEHSIFFLGLVNFNIILFLLLFFLIFRNVAKNFAERARGPLGSSLKGKLIAAFVAFSFVPTTLMFLVSVFYINNSFDKWFSEKMAGILKSSLEVTNAYYLTAKKKNYHFASQIAQEIHRKGKYKVEETLKNLLNTYSLDAVEYYPGLSGHRVMALAKMESLTFLPEVSLEFLKKGVRQKVEASTTHNFEGGDLVRVIVPTTVGQQQGAVVVSSYIPLSLLSRMDDIAAAFEDFRQTNPLEYPVKSIYLVILVLMTLVILLGATWFGVYLAKQLSIPLEELGRATQRVSRGDYQQVNLSAGSTELNRLISSFNTMTNALARSEKKIQDANKNLKDTLTRLDEHTRYMEVVVSNVSTGVLSIDQYGVITMINRHAVQLLGLSSRYFVGKKIQEVLVKQYYDIIADLLLKMNRQRTQTIGKEVRLNINGLPVSIQMTLSVLTDDKNREIGKVVTFDDISALLRAQKAVAWAEVAQRMAHEIKNPLTPIKLCAERLLKKFSQQVNDPIFNQNIAMIMEQVDSLRDLVNEFSHFARLPRAQMKLGSFNQVMESTVKLFVEAHKECQFDLVMDNSLPQFKFDLEQIKRMITNLLSNAVAAVQEQGERKISIRTEYERNLKILKVSMMDTGVGIAPHMLERIFEPYVTTKSQGTGLGLAIVKKTIEDHHGKIKALNHLPRGTKILFELPVWEDQATVNGSSNSSSPLMGV
ncbi:MAG: PAS domain-containing protein [Bdellovibrionales bacterium]|nr:PAS domain-containing protein [Bdellovibrionales bacterium]